MFLLTSGCLSSHMKDQRSLSISFTTLFGTWTISARKPIWERRKVLMIRTFSFISKISALPDLYAVLYFIDFLEPYGIVIDRIAMVNA